MLDPGDVEALAVETYQRAGLDPAEPVAASRLARILYGPDVITHFPWFAGARLAASGIVSGSPRIYVSRALPLRRAHHAIGHEIAHLLFGHAHGLEGPELEASCDLLGAALLAPRPAVLALYRACGRDLRAIARAVVATETCVALRLGEVLGIPLASFGARLRFRGPEAWSWPDARTLATWRRRPPRGVERWPIRDERGRAVLAADV